MAFAKVGILCWIPFLNTHISIPPTEGKRGGKALDCALIHILRKKIKLRNNVEVSNISYMVIISYNGDNHHVKRRGTDDATFARCGFLRIIYLS